MYDRRPFPPAPAGYAETLSDEWKQDADSHWFFYGRAEAMRKQADLILTAFLRRILPEIAKRDDLDAVDRRHMLALNDFLGDSSARAALSEHLTELMTLLRYAPDHYGEADPDYTEVEPLMAMLRVGVERQVHYREMRAQRDRPAQRPN